MSDLQSKMTGAKFNPVDERKQQRPGERQRNDGSILGAVDGLPHSSGPVGGA